MKRSSPSIPFSNSTPIFNYGRISAAKTDLDNLESPFPDGRADWSTMMNKMVVGLPGLSERDIVALLGLHGSGTMNKNNSGFTGPWGPAEDRDKVNNHFFINLYGINDKVELVQKTSNEINTPTGNAETFYNSTPPEQNKIEWTNIGKGGARNFLNIDVEIYLLLTPTSNGSTTQKYYRQSTGQLV